MVASISSRVTLELLSAWDTMLRTMVISVFERSVAGSCSRLSSVICMSCIFQTTHPKPMSRNGGEKGSHSCYADTSNGCAREGCRIWRKFCQEVPRGIFIDTNLENVRVRAMKCCWCPKKSRKGQRTCKCCHAEKSRVYRRKAKLFSRGKVLVNRKAAEKVGLI
jgi:hypothetical protein